MVGRLGGGPIAIRGWVVVRRWSKGWAEIRWCFTARTVSRLILSYIVFHETFQDRSEPRKNKTDWIICKLVPRNQLKYSKHGTAKWFPPSSGMPPRDRRRRTHHNLSASGAKSYPLSLPGSFLVVLRPYSPENSESPRRQFSLRERRSVLR
ncbi:hypothetical protein KFK09_009207 [Dendrobium nobile]|uniref:Uncharacterized protein n=1 Tax=Dendrobium nobile TaxID=94219 RepID=A0A8T3BS08_DENNO|nr:hypothetical protein KFK09_009207 [Dendrobium nobile]